MFFLKKSSYFHDPLTSFWSSDMRLCILNTSWLSWHISYFFWWMALQETFRSSLPEVSLEKGSLEIYSKFTGEHPCRNVTLTKFQSNSIEITLRQACSPANLLYIFRAPFPKNNSRRLLLNIVFLQPLSWQHLKWYFILRSWSTFAHVTCFI